MAYYLARLYTGSGPAEELLQTVVPAHARQLKEAGGLQRYVAGVTDDGRIVSASFYESKEAADRGLLAAAELVAQSDDLKLYQLKQVYRGEIARQDAGPAYGQPGTHSRGRVVTTSMTAEQVADTLIANRSDELRNHPGRVRTTFIQLDDGRVALVSSFTSRDAMERWGEITRQAEANKQEVAEVFAGGAEDITATVHFQQD